MGYDVARECDVIKDSLTNAWPIFLGLVLTSHLSRHILHFVKFNWRQIPGIWGGVGGERMIMVFETDWTYTTTLPILTAEGWWRSKKCFALKRLLLNDIFTKAWSTLWANGTCPLLNKTRFGKLIECGASAHICVWKVRGLTVFSVLNNIPDHHKVISILLHTF